MAAMRTGGIVAIRRVLPAEGREYRESGADAANRQAVHTNTLYGVPRMTEWLRRQGYTLNPKRVRRLMRKMGLEAVYPKPRLSTPG